MKIQETNVRRKQWEVFDPICRDVSPAEAILHLVKYELGYGGRVTKVEETKVVVVTNVMGCEDTVTWAGEPEAMARLYRIAACHALVWHHQKDTLINNAADKLVSLPDSLHAPLFATMLLPFFTGGPSAMMALIAGFDVLDEALVKRVAKLGLEDAVALLVMADQDKMPVADALSAMGC